ncbi:guanine nucleotide binding protein, alpha subunit [Mycena polygramma]|nr:guanine nucleotide binding protein, alpha subunit [Mycena polygramma]
MRFKRPSPVLDTSAEARSREIDELLQQDRKSRKERRWKMLVLSTSGSTKAAFVRQTKALFGDYSDDERRAYKHLIHESVIEAAREMASSIPEDSISVSQVVQCRRVILSASEDLTLTDELRGAIDTLRKVGHTNTTIADPSTNHFFDSLDRLSDPDYMPSDTDIMHCKHIPAPPPMDEIFVRSDTMPTYSLLFPHQPLSARHVWLRCFEDISGVLVLLDAHIYDQPEEMRAALDLLNDVSSSVFFRLTNISLLLCFSPAALSAQLAASPLSAVYPDYAGGSEPQSALNYLLKRFRAVERSGSEWRGGTSLLVDLADAASLRFVLTALGEGLYPRFVGCIML